MPSYFSCDIPDRYVKEVKNNNYEDLVKFIEENNSDPNSFNSKGTFFGFTDCKSAINCENPIYREDNPLLLAISCNCFNSVKALIVKGSKVNKEIALDTPIPHKLPFKEILLKFNEVQINEIIKMVEIKETGLYSIDDEIINKCSFETLYLIYEKSSTLIEGYNKVLIKYMESYPTSNNYKWISLLNFLKVLKGKDVSKNYINDKYNNTTVLIDAVEKGRIEIIKELKDYADPNIYVGNTTALIKAIELNKVDIINILLTFPTIDINLVINNTNNSLINSIKLGYDDISKILLNRPDISTNKIADNTDALLTAIEKNNSEIVNIILSKKQTCEKVIGNTNYLIKAVEVSNVDIVKSLLDSCNPDINVIINEKNALIIALENNKFEIANILLSKITNINSGICEQALNIIRQIEVNSNKTEIKNIITLLSGKSCNQDNSFQNTIENYLKDKDFDKVKTYISSNTDKINKRFTDDKTALEIAIKQNDEKLVKLLLDNGANANTPLHKKFLKDDLVEVKVKENNWQKAIITNFNKDKNNNESYNVKYYNAENGSYNTSFSNKNKDDFRHYITHPLQIAKNKDIAKLLKDKGSNKPQYSEKNIELYPIWAFDDNNQEVKKIQDYIKKTVNQYNRKNKFLSAEIDYLLENFYMKWCYDLNKGKIGIIKEIDKYVNENKPILTENESSPTYKLKILKSALIAEIEPLKQYKIIVQITTIIRSLESKKQPTIGEKFSSIFMPKTSNLLYQICILFIFPIVDFFSKFINYIPYVKDYAGIVTGSLSIGLFGTVFLLYNYKTVYGLINYLWANIKIMLGYKIAEEDEFSFLLNENEETPKFIVDYIKEYINDKYKNVSEYINNLFKKKDGVKHRRTSANKKYIKKRYNKSILRRSIRSKSRIRISKRRRSKSKPRRSKRTSRRSKSRSRRSKSKPRRSKRRSRRSKSKRRRSNKYKLRK